VTKFTFGSDLNSLEVGIVDDSQFRIVGVLIQNFSRAIKWPFWSLISTQWSCLYADAHHVG
jgi:hypothetical protein